MEQGPPFVDSLHVSLVKKIQVIEAEMDHLRMQIGKQKAVINSLCAKLGVTMNWGEPNKGF